MKNKYFIVCLASLNLIACGPTSIGDSKNTVNDSSSNYKGESGKRPVYSMYAARLNTCYYPIDDSTNIVYVEDTVANIKYGLYFLSELTQVLVSRKPSNYDVVLSRLTRDSGVFIGNNSIVKLSGYKDVFRRLYPDSVFVLDSTHSCRLLFKIEYVSFLKEQFSYNLFLQLDSNRNVVDQKMFYSDLAKNINLDDLKHLNMNKIKDME